MLKLLLGIYFAQPLYTHSDIVQLNLYINSVTCWYLVCICVIV